MQTTFPRSGIFLEGGMHSPHFWTINLYAAFDAYQTKCQL